MLNTDLIHGFDYEVVLAELISKEISVEVNANPRLWVRNVARRRGKTMVYRTRIPLICLWTEEALEGMKLVHERDLLALYA